MKPAFAPVQAWTAERHSAGLARWRGIEVDAEVGQMPEARGGITPASSSSSIHRSATMASAGGARRGERGLRHGAAPIKAKADGDHGQCAPDDQSRERMRADH